MAVLSTLANAEDPVMARLRGSLPTTAYHDEPEFESAVNAAKSLVPGALDVAFAGSPASSGGPLPEKPRDQTVSAGREATEMLASPEDPVAEVQPDAVPTDLGDYELLERLGEGGMGAVYKARQKKLKRVVAIKLLPKERLSDSKALARFEREMEAIGSVDHPNIVRAMDAGEYDGSPYLVVEYADGLNLTQVITALGPLRIADACELVRQAAEGLQHAHEQGLVHRDIKPSNLMLAWGPAEGRRVPGAERSAVVKILDLGLVLLVRGASSGQELTASGTAMGTADYVSPEQVTDSHSVDIRSDIYSLGCTLYKLLSGRAPFVGPEYKSEVHKMMAHVRKTPPAINLLRTDLPSELVAIVDRMTAKAPDQRFATPGDVAAALAPFTVGCDLPAMLAEATSILAPPSAGTKSTTADKGSAPPTDTGLQTPGFSDLAGAFEMPAVLDLPEEDVTAGPSVTSVPVPIRSARPSRWPAITLACVAAVFLLLVLGAVALFLRDEKRRTPIIPAPADNEVTATEGQFGASSDR
jgi:serine/threonine protein kinase